MSASTESKPPPSHDPSAFDQLSLFQKGYFCEQRGFILAAGAWYEGALHADTLTPAKRHHAVAFTLYRQQHYERAQIHFARAANLDHANTLAITGWADCLRALDRDTDADTLLELACRHFPLAGHVWRSLCTVLWQTGQSARWLEEWRKRDAWCWEAADQAGRHSLDEVAPPCREWRGEELTGRTLLLWTTSPPIGGNLGDWLMFARFLPGFVGRGARVVVLCPPPLVSVLHTVSGVSDVLPFHSTGVSRWPDADYHLPFDLHVLGRCGITEATIPLDPYLRPPPGRSFELPPTPADARLRVGVIGNGSLNSNWLHAYRSTSLPDLAPVFDVPGIAWYSLQVGPAAVELNAYQLPVPIHDLSPQLLDFGDTAAAIDQLDVVLSVDTSVAHLAGALGKPVWVLLPKVADWQWPRTGERSAWYPTARLFRQRVLGRWSEPVQEVRQALATFLRNSGHRQGEEVRDGISHGIV